MSKGKKIVERLQQVGDQKKPDDDTQTGVDSATQMKHFEQIFDNVTVKIAALDVDKYSMIISKIEMQAEKMQQGKSTHDILQSQANDVIKKIDYLPEIFALIELDDLNGIAQIRSRKPYRNAGAFEYFEILLKNGSRLSFHRYQQQTGGTDKKPIPVVLTYKQFERLIDDFFALWQ